MIEIKNLSSGYGKSIILEDVSMSVRKGELVGIVGVNGCGKSTLLKTIINILPVVSGEITVDKTPIKAMKRRDIAKKIAYLSQEKNIPDMTISELVLHGRFPHLDYPRRYSKNDFFIADKAMEKMGISNIRNKPLTELSGGMRQAAYIAMALASESDYILFDEPTVHLDVFHRVELMKILRSLRDDGKGIAAVMHDLPLALKFCDKIVVIDSGMAATYNSSEDFVASGDAKRLFGTEVLSIDNGNFCYNYGN